MSLFSIQQMNDLKIKFQVGYGEDIYQKNHVTGEYERVGAGSGSAALPAWAYSDRIKFSDGETELNGVRLDAIAIDHERLQNIEQITLPAMDTSIQELESRVVTNSKQLTEITTVTLPAHEASLDELDTRVTTNKNSITAVQGVNNTQNSRLTTLETSDTAQNGRLTTLETSDTKQNGRLTALETSDTTQNGRLSALETSDTAQNGRLTTLETSDTAQNTKITGLQTLTSKLINADSSLVIATSTSSKALFSQRGLDIYQGAATDTPVYPYARLNYNGLSFVDKTATLKLFDYARLEKLDNLYSVSASTLNTGIDFPKKVSFTGGAESTDLTGKKMVVMDGTSKEFSYATIPTAHANLGRNYYKRVADDEVLLVATKSGSTFTTSLSDPQIMGFPYSDNDLILNFADVPMTADNTMTTAATYRNYLLYMEGLTANCLTSCTYYPASTDDMTNITFRTFIEPVKFSTPVVYFVRIEIVAGAISLARNFNGQLRITVINPSSATSYSPTVRKMKAA